MVTNRNSIPGDPNGAWYTSGIRLGSPALTTLGFNGDEFDEVAAIICDVLAATEPASTATGPSKAHYMVPASVTDSARRRCADLLTAHPLYPTIELTTDGL